MYLLEFAGSDDAFAAAEARTAAAGVEIAGAGLGIARSVDPDGVARLAFTRRAGDLVGRASPDVEAARALLRAAALDRSGSVAVRARDVRGTAGVDTPAVERALGDVLVDRGFRVDLDDPDHELRALFAGPASVDADGASTAADRDGAADTEAGVCLLGWLTVESERSYGERRPSDRPFVQPGSMDPLLARAVVNLAGAAPGATVLDPMCGTGGLLIEAALVGARVLGSDAQSRMARGARENLAAALDGGFDVCVADATALPVADGGADAVVVDPPYGRQSKVAGHERRDLVAGALAEARRVADRAVVVGDRPWTAAATDAGWRVTDRFERRVHRSLTRHVLVLAPADAS